MKKYCFNMIEIILAISIIAIGISSVMALFTSGLKASTATVVYSKMPDISESVLSFIRTRIDNCRSADGWNVTELNKIAPETAAAAAWDISSLLAEGTDGEAVKGDNSGRFLFRQLEVSEYDNAGKPSKYIPAFSALATVTRIKDGGRLNDIVLSDPVNPEKAPFEKRGEVKDIDGKTGTALMDRFRVVVQVTLSYPADEPKESKTYVMECFNDLYDRFTKEGENAVPTP